jgi:hypothetical protein
LYRTVHILRSLRGAMKQNDWPKVEEILTELDKSVDNPIQIHPNAEKELQVIRNQLDMRTSIVDLSKALKTGWAQCSNGIVDTDTLQIDSLIDAISRAERSMHDLGISNDVKKFNARISIHSPLVQNFSLGGKTDIAASLNVKEDGKLNTQVVASPSIKRYRKHFPTPESGSRKKLIDKKDETTPQEIVPKSKLQEQVEKLLLSAGVVAEVRKALYDGHVQLAGELSEEALQIQELHSSVQEELAHYATEIGRALHMMKLCSDLRAGISEGNGETLEKILQEARDASIEISSDLGLVRTMEKAQAVLKSINKTKKELMTVSNIYSQQRYSFLYVYSLNLAFLVLKKR